MLFTYSSQIMLSPFYIVIKEGQYPLLYPWLRNEAKVTTKATLAPGSNKGTLNPRAASRASKDRFGSQPADSITFPYILFFSTMLLHLSLLLSNFMTVIVES